MTTNLPIFCIMLIYSSNNTLILLKFHLLATGIFIRSLSYMRLRCCLRAWIAVIGFGSFSALCLSFFREFVIIVVCRFRDLGGRVIFGGLGQNGSHLVLFSICLHSFSIIDLILINHVMVINAETVPFPNTSANPSLISLPPSFPYFSAFSNQYNPQKQNQTVHC